MQSFPSSNPKYKVLSYKWFSLLPLSSVAGTKELLIALNLAVLWFNGSSVPNQLLQHLNHFLYCDIGEKPDDIEKSNLQLVYDALRDLAKQNMETANLTNKLDRERAIGFVSNTTSVAQSFWTQWTDATGVFSEPDNEFANIKPMGTVRNHATKRLEKPETVCDGKDHVLPAVLGRLVLSFWNR
ncbi:hypothetical protein HAX54_037171 [Datura stramonium]|uniref:Uncharacterized protein n=1 Tax=Datura stramonium TaxID=4076 RepID=A0ABS8VJ68_DATST|nr:hypothetical protein [Datura stramonium]